jgi:hypothetical protein
MRRVIGPALLASSLLIMSGQAALGAGPVHDKFAVDETFTEELCGIEVTAHLEINGNVLIFEDRFVDLSRIEITWTNAEGDWLRNAISGPAFIEEQLDGEILTITERHAGIHSHLTSAAGHEPVFDRGTVTFLITIDLNDLENEEDDVLLSFETIFVAGPHPELESDFALFCEVVEAVLG